jgi:DivIVA domain-containing protein
MGIFIAVCGWMIICLGTIGAGRFVRGLAKAIRNKASASAVLVEVSLLLGWTGTISLGVLDLRYPHYPHGTSLRWLPAEIYGASFATLITAGVVHLIRRGNSSADPTGPDSANTQDPGPALDASTKKLIERIKNVKFSTTRLAPGYDEEEVDIFLDKLVATLSEGSQLYSSVLRNARFSTTRLRPGYVIADVHAFLDEVAQAT